MSIYRRDNTKGAVFFFTVVTKNRKLIFTDDNSVQILRDACRAEQQRHPFVMLAAVILPDHIHCVWQLPEGDSDFSSRWREIKKRVTKRLRLTGNYSRNEEIWQPRFWEHRIRDDTDLRHHLDYIHYNPVKHGYVRSPKQWRWSSFHSWVERNAYDKDWGSTPPDNIQGADYE